VADDDHRVAASRDGRAQCLRVRARRQPLVGLWFGVERAGELRCCLACPEQWAGEDGVRTDSVGGESAAQFPGSGPPGRCERPQVVGLARSSLGMADEVDTHAARIRADP
jgi:hypothetical protein